MRFTIYPVPLVVFSVYFNLSSLSVWLVAAELSLVDPFVTANQHAIAFLPTFPVVLSSIKGHLIRSVPTAVFIEHVKFSEP